MRLKKRLSFRNPGKWPQAPSRRGPVHSIDPQPTSAAPIWMARSRPRAAAVPDQKIAHQHLCMDARVVRRDSPIGSFFWFSQFHDRLERALSAFLSFISASSLGGLYEASGLVRIIVAIGRLLQRTPVR